MRAISLRRLLSKLTVLALSASPAAAANTPDPSPSSQGTLDDDLDLGEDIPIDREHIDPDDAAEVLGRGLARALAEMRQIEAIHLSTTWALSQDPVRRAAVAKALEWSFPLLPDALILDHLSYDRSAMVRAATARSAWARRAVTRDAAVLARLSEDPDPEVRAIAARAR